jgi:hypothetical protein
MKSLAKTNRFLDELVKNRKRAKADIAANPVIQKLLCRDCHSGLD